jgi:hypothetical protein
MLDPLSFVVTTRKASLHLDELLGQRIWLQRDGKDYRGAIESVTLSSMLRPDGTKDVQCIFTLVILDKEGNTHRLVFNEGDLPDYAYIRNLATPY